MAGRGPEVSVGSLTDVGLVRTENQDSLGSLEPADAFALARKGRLFVVCDGMGGHAGGRVASRIAAAAVVGRYRDAEAAPPEALRAALEAANREIYLQASREPDVAGMGSTAVALALRGGEAHVAWVGDSRAYLVRGGRIQALTTDHSLVRMLFDEGLILEEEMARHPRKNVLLRSLGLKPTVEVDATTVPVAAGDIFVLATDGLTGPVAKEEILEAVLYLPDDPSGAARRLVTLANARGGEDNVTVTIVRVLQVDADAGPPGPGSASGATRRPFGPPSPPHEPRAPQGA